MQKEAELNATTKLLERVRFINCVLSAEDSSVNCETGIKWIAENSHGNIRNCKSELLESEMNEKWIDNDEATFYTDVGNYRKELYFTKDDLDEFVERLCYKFPSKFDTLCSSTSMIFWIGLVIMTIILIIIAAVKCRILCWQKPQENSDVKSENEKCFTSDLVDEKWR